MTVYIQDNIFLGLHAEARRSLVLEPYNFGVVHSGMRYSEDDCSPVNCLLRVDICNVCSCIQASGNQNS